MKLKNSKLMPAASPETAWQYLQMLLACCLPSLLRYIAVFRLVIPTIFSLTFWDMSGVNPMVHQLLLDVLQQVSAAAIGN